MKDVFGRHPNFFFAFDASPFKKSTSGSVRLAPIVVDTKQPKEKSGPCLTKLPPDEPDVGNPFIFGGGVNQHFRVGIALDYSGFSWFWALATAGF